MKKILIISLILVITNCTADNIATDSQRSWCYSKAGLGQVETLYRPSQETQRQWGNLRSARNLYENDTGKKFYLPSFKERLEKETQSSLELCKIWADMNDID